MSKLNSLVISSLTLAAVSFAFVACGGAGTPPPLPAEVPMDQGSSGSSSSTDSTATTAAPANPPSSDADPSAAMMGGGSDPSAAAATPPASDPSATGDKPGKGKKGKKGAAGGGGGLSKSECQELSNKGLDLKMQSMGITDPSMGAQLKSQMASDPNMAGMISECLKSQTRAQYQCGMAASSEPAWETCLK